MLVILPTYILFANNGEHTPAGVDISGEFTIYNHAWDVTIELRQDTADGNLMEAAIIPITYYNLHEPAYFIFYNVPPGVYSLIFRQPGHTRFTVNDIIVVTGAGNIDLTLDPYFPSQLPLLPGNASGSGQVNILDLNILLHNWMGDYENANFTNSGQINLADLNMLLRNWMATSVEMNAAPVTVVPTPEPTPTPTPEPTPEPTPYPYWNNPHHVHFIYTRSSIQLPNEPLPSQARAAWIQEYYYNGGASAFELRMINQINIVREGYGLHPLAIAPSLMHAARFHTQIMANLDLELGSNVGPYGGSRQTAHAFGVSLFASPTTSGQWSGGSGNWGGWSYTAILALWLENSSHRNFILSPNNNYIGFGSHLGGRHGVFHYLLLSNRL